MSREIDEELNMISNIISNTDYENSVRFLVNKYKASLYWIIYKIVNNPTDAEDLTSETFMKALNSLTSYSSTHPFSTWLYSIGHNQAIDFLRKKSQQPKPINNPISTEEDIMTPSLSLELSGEEMIINEERNSIIKDIINELNPFARSLIELKYYKGMSYEEMATKLNKPIGTIKTGLYRAKRSLYKLMKKNKNLT